MGSMWVGVWVGWEGTETQFLPGAQEETESQFPPETQEGTAKLTWGCDLPILRDQ